MKKLLTALVLISPALAFAWPSSGGGGSGTATALQTASGTVSISGAAAPTSGQVLSATSATAAVWASLTGTGTVTSVTSANPDITVATSTTTPVLTLVEAPALQSATTTVNVSSATAPTAGQVLTASSPTAATWATIGNVPSATTATNLSGGSVSATTMAMSGTLLNSTGAGLTVQNTGDIYGAVSFSIFNRTGINGLQITNTGEDLVDSVAQTSTGAIQNIRFEHRSGELINAANTAGEYQIGPGYNASIGHYPNFVIGSVVQSLAPMQGTSLTLSGTLTSASKAGLTPVAITVGASPFAYTATATGSVAVSGGAVTNMTLTRGGTVVWNTTLSSAVIPVTLNDVVTVTYTTTPTMNELPN